MATGSGTQGAPGPLVEDEGRPGGAGPDRGDRVRLLVAVVATTVAAADLVRLDLTATGSWPSPLVWSAAVAWAWWLYRRLDRTVRSPEPHRRGRSPAVAAAVAVAAFATVLVGVGLHRANPLVTHDEAVYSALARSWTGPLPAAGFRPFRPPGVSALGAVVLRLFGDSSGPDHQLVLLRGLAVVLTLAALAALLALGRSVTTPARAATAVLVVVASATFQGRVHELLNDIPAAGLLCLTALLLLRAMRTGRPQPLLLAVLAAVGAFYLRYGVLTALVALGLAAVVADGPRTWWARRGQLAVAAAVGLLGLAPFFGYSIWESGTPWGVLSQAQAVAHPTYFGDGLVHYLLWAPIRLLGNLGGVVLLAAVLALVFALRRPVGDDRRRWTVLLAGAGLVQVVALGLTAHAEERYVYFPVMAAAVVGVDALARAAGRHGRPAVALLAVFAVLQIPASYWYEDRKAGALRDRYVALAAAARQAGPGPCLAVGPRWGPAPDPEVGWYSGCDVTPVSSALRSTPGGVRLVLLVGTGADRDPRVERALPVLLDRARREPRSGPTVADLSVTGPGGHGIRLVRP